MKRGPKPEDFDTLAHSLGFEDELEMFIDLYDTKDHSLPQIAIILGYSISNIRRRMIKLGIELHGPGRRVGAKVRRRH